ncbi:E3 ubiquitin ligase complex SCF subunit sconC [Hypoxylon rubiginosum]|uniref:E3 ubiquitin ligase complex SCF subunit sconC n=1 Tax=Hypoxylon rubiginosum TaxID=110542 RepID=A0ACB9YTC7_9PEZI|nr:E3 ubiquitin ligase complex SCF subunit sconC [Hypoxylon rubiginosum]
MAAELTGTLMLISGDGTEITISRNAARHSQILADLMEDLPETETELPIPLDAVDGASLKIVVEWCEHFAAHQAPQGLKPVGPSKIPQWDAEFLTFEDNDTIFAVTNAANYMNVQPLLDYAIKTIAAALKGKSTEEMREYLGIESDFTPEEEAQIRSETQWAEGPSKNYW